jgi:hypothetical protein
MKNAILSVLVVGCCSILVAQEATSPKNAIGWESGISYRRQVTSKIWIGLTLDGTMNLAKSFDTTYNIQQINNPDTILSQTTYQSDTTTSYSLGTKLSIGREIIKINKFQTDAFISGKYTYFFQKSWRNGNGGAYNSSPRHIFSGLAGVEPKIRILERVELGSKIGIQYDYSMGTQYSNSGYAYSGSSSISKLRRKSDYQSIYLFGNTSLTSSLNLFIWF